mmetsp:Transcript_12006/g.28129  ORF Transcript_12006/g.28129 Transcript_12006/m.28129 type:complete len:157 (-) Transcript_12006:133-603(-)
MRAFLSFMVALNVGTLAFMPTTPSTKSLRLYHSRSLPLKAAIDDAREIFIKELEPDDQDLQKFGENFSILTERVGEASAVKMCRSAPLMFLKDPSRVSDSFDAWVDRFLAEGESREEAAIAITKNPNLLACLPAGIADAPVGATKAYAAFVGLFQK